MIERQDKKDRWPSDLRAEREKTFRENLTYDVRLDARDRDGKWYCGTL